ncbi:MAG: protein-L-isoaspartate(D-aspartate) O-methyltransferase [Alphaproteobacteria bacterium]
MNEGYLSAWRQQMVQEIAAEAGNTAARTGKQAFGERVMEVMGKVPRHEFVPVELKNYAYVNLPLPIGYGKTISQPFIVALMTDLLEVEADDVVLEIGTGLGYQAAILAELVKKVYSVEIIEELAVEGKKRLEQLGYTNVETRVSDGYQGWPHHAPFDAIIVTAAPDLIPAPLIHQLKAGGRMVVPAGATLDDQQLLLVEKDPNGRVKTKEILPVRFSQLVTDADI